MAITAPVVSVTVAVAVEGAADVTVEFDKDNAIAGAIVVPPVPVDPPPAPPLPPVKEEVPALPPPPPQAARTVISNNDAIRFVRVVMGSKKAGGTLKSRHRS